MNSKLYIAAIATLALSKAALAQDYACEKLVSAVVLAAETVDGAGMIDGPDLKKGIKITSKQYSQVKILGEKDIPNRNGEDEFGGLVDLTVKGETLKGVVRVRVGRFGVCNIEKLALSSVR